MDQENFSKTWFWFFYLNFFLFRRQYNRKKKPEPGALSEEFMEKVEVPLDSFIPPQLPVENGDVDEMSPRPDSAPSTSAPSASDPSTSALAASPLPKEEEEPEEKKKMPSPPKIKMPTPKRPKLSK